MSFRDLARSFAQSVTIENKPSRAGIVRRIALSDQLALGFYTQKSVNLGEYHFDLPSTDEPGEDVARTGVGVCGEEGLRLEVAFDRAREVNG